MAESGNLYVIAAPSGTGKTTLVTALVESLPKITVSISHTTRPKRPNEKHGVNYYFVSKEEFLALVNQDGFLEHAEIFNYHYGTSKRWVEETLANGIDVILEIDWQGHLQIKRLFPNAIGIFLLPPSLEILRERLIKRDQDHPEIIKKRLADAKETVSHIKDFDYAIMNDDFMHALNDLKIIVEAGRLSKRRQLSKYEKMISDLSNMATE